MIPTPPPVSPIKAKLNQFRLDRQRQQEAILSDDGEHLRKAIENNSWLLVRRLLDVPGAHEATDELYPRGLISAVPVDALSEVCKRSWTVLHSLCYHGAPAALVVHTVTRLLSEEKETNSDMDSDTEEDEEEINWNDDPEADDQKKQAEKEKENLLEEAEEESDPHPVSLVDDLKNNMLHLLFSRSTRDGDGTKRPSRSETKNTMNISQTLLAFVPHLASMKNLNGHTPLHILLTSTGAGGRLDIPLLRLLKKCHPKLVEDVAPVSKATPLALVLLMNSPYKIVELMLQWYPDSIKLLDGKGRTPLHCSLMVKDPQIAIVKLLIKEYRFAVNVIDDMGRTPLLTAVVTAGAEHPPPMALMALLKGQDEWFHPHPQIYRSFDWYASGTKIHPHVCGRDFDNIDVTTPAVLNSTKIKIQNPECISNHDVHHKQINVKNPRAAVLEKVRSRLPPKSGKMVLDIISPKGGSIYPRHTEAQFNNEISPIKQSFRWYKEGNTTGPDFLGNMALGSELHHHLDYTTNVANRLRDSTAHHHLSSSTLNSSLSPTALSTFERNTTANSPTGEITTRTRTNGKGSPGHFQTVRNHFQLSSTMSGQRRVAMINAMNLSPRYSQRLRKKALSSRDYQRSSRRSHQMRGPLRSQYFRNPILLRNETPDQKKGYTLNLPDVVVDASESRRREHLL